MTAVGRQVQFVGLCLVVAAGLAATVLAIIGFWLALVGLGLRPNTGDSPVGLIGIVFVCVAAAVLWISWNGCARLSRRLALAPVCAVGSMVAVYAGGFAIATLLWSVCSEGTGATRAGPALAFIFASGAIVGVVVSRPIDFTLGVLVGVVASATVGLWWLSANTAAAGCPWYQPASPTPVPAPMTTTSVPDG